MLRQKLRKKLRWNYAKWYNFVCSSIFPKQKGVNSDHFSKIATDESPIKNTQCQLSQQVVISNYTRSASLWYLQERLEWWHYVCSFSWGLYSSALQWCGLVSCLFFTNDHIVTYCCFQLILIFDLQIFMHVGFIWYQDWRRATPS